MRVHRLEENETLQNLSLSVFHATTHAFSGMPAVKIVETHIGRAFIKQHIVQPMPAVQIGIDPNKPSSPQNPDSPR